MVFVTNHSIYDVELPHAYLKIYKNRGIFLAFLGTFFVRRYVSPEIRKLSGTDPPAETKNTKSVSQFYMVNMYVDKKCILKITQVLSVSSLDFKFLCVCGFLYFLIPLHQIWKRATFYAVCVSVVFDSIQSKHIMVKHKKHDRHHINRAMHWDIAAVE